MTASTVSAEQIVDTLTAIVVKELAVPADAMTPETDLRTVEGADSVKVLRVIAKIEREYDVELEDEDVFAVSSIADVAAVVLRALRADAV